MHNPNQHISAVAAELAATAVLWTAIDIDKDLNAASTMLAVRKHFKDLAEELRGNIPCPAMIQTYFLTTPDSTNAYSYLLRPTSELVRDQLIEASRHATADLRVEIANPYAPESRFLMDANKMTCAEAIDGMRFYWCEVGTRGEMTDLEIMNFYAVPGDVKKFPRDEVDYFIKELEHVEQGALVTSPLLTDLYDRREELDEIDREEELAEAHRTGRYMSPAEIARDEAEERNRDF